MMLFLAPHVARLARSLARRLPPHVEIDDLVAAGYLGLVLALRDEEQRPEPRTLEPRIRGAMLDHLRSLDPLTRTQRRAMRRSLEGDELAFVPFDDSAALDAASEWQAELFDLRRAMQRLPERTQRLLRLLYRDELTLRTVASLMGSSHARIHQLHREALRRLRRVLGGTELES